MTSYTLVWVYAKPRVDGATDLSLPADRILTRCIDVIDAEGNDDEVISYAQCFMEDAIQKMRNEGARRIRALTGLREFHLSRVLVDGKVPDR